jgi:hypothetical protein
VSPLLCGGLVYHTYIYIYPLYIHIYLYIPNLVESTPIGLLSGPHEVQWKVELSLEGAVIFQVWLVCCLVLPSSCWPVNVRLSSSLSWSALMLKTVFALVGQTGFESSGAGLLPGSFFNLYGESVFGCPGDAMVAYIVFFPFVAC